MNISKKYHLLYMHSGIKISAVASNISINIIYFTYIQVIAVASNVSENIIHFTYI